MALTVSDFREQFPEAPFAVLSDATITRALRDAAMLHSINELASLYCTAHLLALAAEESDILEPDGGAGVVSSETIGPRTIRYVTQASGMDDGAWRSFFATSPYGRTFLAMERRTAKVAFGMIVA